LIGSNALTITLTVSLEGIPSIKNQPEIESISVNNGVPPIKAIAGMPAALSTRPENAVSIRNVSTPL
jgi:hypothetical protein